MILNNFLSKVELFFLKRIFEKTVKQGNDHNKRIQAMYLELLRTSKNEFTEDNRPTFEHFMNELHENAMNDLWKEKNGEQNVSRG